MKTTIEMSPLPFGIQLFTDQTAQSRQLFAGLKSPLPFGIQLFTDRPY